MKGCNKQKGINMQESSTSEEKAAASTCSAAAAVPCMFAVHSAILCSAPCPSPLASTSQCMHMVAATLEATATAAPQVKSR